MGRNSMRVRWGAGVAAAAGSLVAGLLVLPSATASTHAPGIAESRASSVGYTATIRRTSYGVPHIKADSFGDLGFGTGFAQAEDNVCVIAESIVTSDGDRSQYFGTTDSNVQSDLFFRDVNASGVVPSLLEGEQDGVHSPSPRARDLVSGFVAGYNQFVDTGEITDPACQGAPWVHDISELEYWQMLHASLIRAGSRAFLGGIVAAAPPQTTVARPLRSGADAGDALLSAPDGTSAGIGSNAYGLGRDAVAGNGGMVLGNPHFPWDGPERFYRLQQTIPGVYNVEGASLLGSPMVQIGHNATLAWSHTVSTARRFVLRKLQLVPGNPTSYVVDGQPEEMTQRSVSAGGVTKTFYSTRYGPVVVSSQFPWSTSTAYALTDINDTNSRAVDGWMAMGQASTVRKLKATLDHYQHLPWVNVIAADSRGEAMYADHSVIPRVTPALAASCIDTAGQFIYSATGVAVLDGSTTSCDLGTDPDAAVPGIFGPDNLPIRFRDDYVTNSNNSYWLANPAQPLTGFPRIIGDEKTQRTLRTRIGLIQVAQRLAGTDGLPGKGFTTKRLWKVMFGNRVYGGELVRDDLVSACTQTPTVTATDGQSVDLTGACAALAGWDLKANLDSTGLQVFREFVAAGGLKFAVPFDVSHPVTTPRTLDTTDPAVLKALADAVEKLQGIPLDAPLGQVQTESRGSEAIPIHGDRDADGAFNVITAPRVPGVGYPSVDSGSSFVMAVKLGSDGPTGRQILTYSESTNPSSPWYADQTELFSHKGWDTIKYTNKQIKADPNLDVYVVSTP